MIPKILHFIWIGYKPKYIDYTIQAYKKVNPQFEINLINYTNSQLESLYFDKAIYTELDQHIYNLLNSIFNNNGYYDLLQFLVTNVYMADTAFIQTFCDILRLEVLNLYGGIYLDCDTYPINPIDDELLKHDKFCVYDKYRTRPNALHENNYFLGMKAGLHWNNYYDGDCYKFIHDNNQQFSQVFGQKSLDFVVRRLKFFRCMLTEKDFENVKTSDYFEHYSEFRWGTGKVLKTKFDDIFDKRKYYYKALNK